MWRFLYVADSEAQAEDDDVHEATFHYRQHMHHVREAYNPADFRVSAGGDQSDGYARASHRTGEAGRVAPDPRRDVAERQGPRCPTTIL